MQYDLLRCSRNVNPQTSRALPTCLFAHHRLELQVDDDVVLEGDVVTCRIQVGAGLLGCLPGRAAELLGQAAGLLSAKKGSLGCSAFLPEGLCGYHNSSISLFSH